MGRAFYYTVFMLLVLVSLMVPKQLQSQSIKSNGITYQVWEGYNARFFMPKYRMWWRNDIGLRQAFNYEPFNRVYVRSRLIINIGSYFDFQPGIDFHYTNFQESPNRSEIRTFQGLGISWPNFGRVTFEHLYRFEQRFYNLGPLEDEEFSLRSRYRLKMRIPLNNTTVTEKTFFITLRGEAYLPHTNNIQEVYANRLRGGIEFGYNMNANWRYYLTFFVDRGKNEFDQNRTIDSYICSVTARHVINRKQ